MRSLLTERWRQITFHWLCSVNEMKRLYTWKSKLDPSEEKGTLQNLNSFPLQCPLPHLGSILVVTSSLLISFIKFFVSSSPCLGWNLLIHNQPVDISSSYNVFCIPPCSTYLLPPLKCPGNTVFPPLPSNKASNKTHFMNAKEDILKHVGRFSSVPKSCPDCSLASMCNVSAPSRDFLGEYLITTSLDWCASNRVEVIWLPAARASP